MSRSVSEIYGIPMGTLANMRWQKKGPKYFKRGRKAFYFFEDVEAWIKEFPVLTIDSIKSN
ncbi:helix-turn-helix domain-containing protein [Thermodesulfobacteriota bacterium]